MEKQRVKKLVITLESFLPSAIETQASLLPIPPNSKSQVLCLPLIPPITTESIPASSSKGIHIAQISRIQQLPDTTIKYILSLREQWLTRLEACIDSLLGSTDVQAQCQWQGAGERVVFMLGGITGVKFACVRKIAEDVTGGALLIAKEIFERVQYGWNSNGVLLQDQGGREECVLPRTPTPKGESQSEQATTPTRPHSVASTSRNCSQERSPNSRITFFSASACLPVDSQDTLINDAHSNIYEGSIAPSRESYATASSGSSLADDGPHILISKAYALDFDKDSRPSTPAPSSRRSRFSSEPVRSKLRRPNSMIILPPAASTTDDNFDATTVLHSRTSLNDIRGRTYTPLGTSWYGSRDSKLDDSALESLLERGLSIKKAMTNDENHSATVITGNVDEFERFGGRLPDTRKNDRNKDHTYGSESSFLQLTEDDIQSSVDIYAADNYEVDSCHSRFGFSKVDVRSSWLAPPTAVGELEEMFGVSKSSRHEEFESVPESAENEDLFPTLLIRLQKSIGNELIDWEWCEGVLYLDADTPRVCLERVVYEWLLEESVEDEALHNQMPSASPDAQILSAAQSWGWRAQTGKFESMPLFPSPTNVRKVKLTGRKRKNGIEIQNEVRAFVRDLIQATSSSELHHDNQSVFEVYPDEPSEVEFETDDGEEEENLTLWRDMFSTRGQWPLSTVNLIVALGREGPTNTVKGGSGRVMSEAMARRLAGWDLRCRRISLRYLLYLARRNGHLASVPLRPPPRQLIAELEFFLSLHEPTDLLILEFNTSSREETEAVLELSSLLGRGSYRPSSDREPSTMLRMACVFSGEVPRNLDLHGIVVGNSPEFATSNTTSDSTPFEGFRFPTCRSPGTKEQKQRPLSTWIKNLITVADLVVEDCDTENESRQQRYHSVPLESQLEHIFGVLDHWTAVARLLPSSAFELSQTTSPAPSTPIIEPSQTPLPMCAKPVTGQLTSTPSKPAGRKRGASRTLLEVIVTAFTEVDGEDAEKQEYRQLATCREVFCQSPSSGGTFLEDAADEDSSSEDDYDLGINGFQPSIGIIEAHEQSDTDLEVEEDEAQEDASVVEDYDMVVAMQYASRSAPRISRKVSKSQKKRAQVWFRSKKRTDVPVAGGIPALKRMKVMRLSTGCASAGRTIHGRTRSKDAKGELGLVLVSNKALKLLGIERDPESP